MHVCTLPAVLIRLIMWLPWSATHALPVESTDIPKGFLNFATVPTPFKEPAAVLPATVLTTPAVITHIHIHTHALDTIALSYEHIRHLSCSLPSSNASSIR